MKRCSHGFLSPLCEVCHVQARRQASIRKRGNGECCTLPGMFCCIQCGANKPLSEFYLSRTMKRGHQSRCKRCDNSERVKRVL